MNITLEHFYALLRESVRQSVRNDLPCLQLQSFRVLAESFGSEIGIDTLGATPCDKDRPYFWSRKWDALNNKADKITFDWPLLYVFETSGVRTNPFGARDKVNATLEIGVLDIVQDDCAKGRCSGCPGRTSHEIYRDTQGLLSGAMRYVGGAVWASVDGGSAGLYNEATLREAYGAAGYEIVNHWGSTLENTAKNIAQFRVDYPAKRILGTAITVTLPFIDCTPADQAYLLPIPASENAQCC